MIIKIVATFLCFGCILYGVFLQSTGSDEFYAKHGDTTPMQQKIKRIAGWTLVVIGVIAWIVLKHFGLMQ